MWKSLSLKKKYFSIFWNKKSQESRQDRKQNGRRTGEETIKWNQMTALKFPTGEKTSDILGLPFGFNFRKRHIPSPAASLKGSLELN